MGLQQLAKVFFGVDASHHAVSRAVGHALISHGLPLKISQEEANYELEIKSSTPVGARRFWLIIRLNDAYFHPTEGGQRLLSVYPVAASFSVENDVADSLANSVEEETLTAAAVLDEVLDAIFVDLQWPMIVTTADGELLVVYRPGVTKQSFNSGAVNGRMPFEAWTQLIAPAPWPTVEDYE